MALQFRTAKKWVTRRVTPDYTNQLDLFSEAPLEAPAPVASAPAQPSGVVPVRPRQQQLDFGPWEALPPEYAVRIPTAKPAPASNGGNGVAVDQPPVRPEIGPQDETSTGVETGDRRDPEAGKVLDVEPEQKPSRDFRITSAHRIGQGSLQEKARDNIASIRLLKALEAENREATEDENPVLARYVGWGAMPNVFGHYPPEAWRSTAEAVKELLTGPELESARPRHRTRITRLHRSSRRSGMRATISDWGEVRRCWSPPWAWATSLASCRSPSTAATGRAWNWIPSRPASPGSSIPMPRSSLRGLRKRLSPTITSTPSSATCRSGITPYMTRR